MDYIEEDARGERMRVTCGVGARHWCQHQDEAAGVCARKEKKRKPSDS